MTMDAIQIRLASDADLVLRLNELAELVAAERLSCSELDVQERQTSLIRFELLSRRQARRSEQMTGQEDANHETHVTAIAYGGCCEPGGLELTDESWTGACPNPECGKDANYFRWERAEGSLNVYTGYVCDHCGSRRCDPWWPEGMGDEYEWEPGEDWEEEPARPGFMAGVAIWIRETARDFISALAAAVCAFRTDWQGSRYRRALGLTPDEVARAAPLKGTMIISRGERIRVGFELTQHATPPKPSR